MSKGNDPKQKPPAAPPVVQDDKGGEVPTITSLLGRRKLSKKKPEVKPEPSQQIDPTKTGQTAGHSRLTGRTDHPSINDQSSKSNDMWATRGIARGKIGGGGNQDGPGFRSPLAPDDHTDEKKNLGEVKIIQDAPIQLTLDPSAEPLKLEIERAPAPPQQLTLEPPAPTHAPSQGNAVTVQVASRRSKREEAKPPVHWTPEMLKGGSDPLGKGLSLLIERGCRAALFLSIAPPPPGGRLPQFVAAAATHLTRDQLALWTGLRWDPSLAPQVWNQLLKAGFVEFPPPGGLTNVGSGRNTIRAAFGLSGDDTLLLIRIGPVAACRGILAVFSDKSMIIHLSPILTLFSTPPKQAKVA